MSLEQTYTEVTCCSIITALKSDIVGQIQVLQKIESYILQDSTCQVTFTCDRR